MYHSVTAQNTESGFHIEANPYGFSSENTSLFGHESFNSPVSASDLSCDRIDLANLQAAQQHLSRGLRFSAPVVSAWHDELALLATNPDRSFSAPGDWLTGLSSTTALLSPADANSTTRLEGTLDRTDPNNPLRNGSFYDGYDLTDLTDLEDGEQVRIRVDSDDFDTYLQVINADTGALVAFDDDGGPGLNSQLTFTAQAGVDYSVQVTSYAPGATGRYTLTTTVEGGGGSTPGFSNIYGYGHIDAAALVATALGQPTFANVANLGGDYWGLDQVNAPEVWSQGYTGEGVVVAVIDTGVDYNHVDLADNIWVNPGEIANNGIDDDGNGFIDDIRGWDFAYDDNNPRDRAGHGTHVAGSIAANGTNFARGVAPDATIMPIQVLDNNGFGTNRDIADGITYAVNNGADVINLSLGGGFSAAIRNAIRYAWNQGVSVIMASGNEYDSQPGFPARHAANWGIAVGAVDFNRQVADFSNWAGPTVLDYVVAPGVDIVSTTPRNNYDSSSGTSMATPYVAGVAALLLSAVPTLTVNQLENLITSTANPTGITV